MKYIKIISCLCLSLMATTAYGLLKNAARGGTLSLLKHTTPENVRFENLPPECEDALKIPDIKKEFIIKIADLPLRFRVEGPKNNATLVIDYRELPLHYLQSQIKPPEPPKQPWYTPIIHPLAIGTTGFVGVICLIAGKKLGNN